ncbi:MAG: putative rhamnosyl transferase [Rhodobacteraceae bacterium HLUCCA12]|nr:MAG: putative rhamnosyl transferase [Rhodobacteraceae bacterium HLUCCA12]
MHETPRERARYLYAPARMEERFRYFESFTLPSLRGQTDQDFSLIVVIGPDLPEPYLARLRDLLAGLPQAVVQVQAPGQHRPVMQGAINAARRWDKKRCIQFRIDDDDAVNLRFVERLRQIAHDAGPLIASSPTFAIDFNNGHVAYPGTEGIFALPVRRSFWAPGLAAVMGPWNKQTIMNFNHARIWERMPALSLPAPDMFVRGLGRHNDSGFDRGEAPALLDRTQEVAFRAAYGICADQIRTLFAARR